MYTWKPQMTSIFEGQPPQNKAELPIKTRVIWVQQLLKPPPGLYVSPTNGLING